MHRIDQHGDIFWRRELRYAVSQIEDMPAAMAECAQNLLRMLAYDFRTREQNCRIEIAL